MIGPGLYSCPSRRGDWLIGSLGITNKIGWSMIGSGQGVTVLSNGLLGSILNLERCSNFTVSGMSFIGVRTNNTSSHDVASALITGSLTNGFGFFDSLSVSNYDSHGILFIDSAGPAGYAMTYQNCTFAGIGTLLHAGLGRDGAALFFDNATMIKGCRFFGNVRDVESWSFKDMSGIQIEGCRFEGTTDISIWNGIEAATVKVRNVKISNCEWYLDNSAAFATFKPVAVLNKGSEGFIFTGNYVEGGAFGIVNDTPFLYPIVNFVISDNIFRGQYWDAINLGRNGNADPSTNVVVTRNQFTLQGRDGIRMSISRAEISGNRFERNGTNGLGAAYGISSGISTLLPNTNTLIANNWFTDMFTAGIRINAESWTNFVLRNRIEGPIASPVSDVGNNTTIVAFP